MTFKHNPFKRSGNVTKYSMFNGIPFRCIRWIRWIRWIMGDSDLHSDFPCKVLQILFENVMPIGIASTGFRGWSLHSIFVHRHLSWSALSQIVPDAPVPLFLDLRSAYGSQKVPRYSVFRHAAISVPLPRRISSCSFQKDCWNIKPLSFILIRCMVWFLIL